MQYASQLFGGGRATKTIKTGQSVAGFTLLGYSTSSPFYKRVNSGALTANTLATIFSKTDGPCEMSHLAIVTADATARTMRVVVEIDGVTATPAFDFTSASNAAAERCCILAGTNVVSQPAVLPPIRSNSSLVVKVATSVASETDKFYIDYAFQELS